jgi:hypothetical protein
MLVTEKVDLWVAEMAALSAATTAVLSDGLLVAAREL